MLHIGGCQWRYQGKFKTSTVISLLCFLFSLTFGKGILMSSLAPFKGVRIPEYGKFRNAESRIHRVPPLHWGTLGQVQPSCCVGCPVLVLELKSCMLCPSCNRILPGPKIIIVFNAGITLFSIICRVIIKGFLIHEQVKTNTDKIKLHAHIVNLS